MQNLFFLFASIIVAFSCNFQNKEITIKEETEITFSYPKTILPTDTTKLWIAAGDSSKQIVAIFLQGGPKDELNFAKRGRSSWRYLPEFNEYYQIHLHQSNTLNTDIFRYQGEFTMDMARKEIDNSSEILHRAIQYFKNKGKTVWVFGHSFGAFIIPHYLTTRLSTADQYIIVSGRLDDPKNVVDAHTKGFNGFYEEGITFISDENKKDFREYNDAAIKYYTGKQKLKAAIGELLYIETLKDIELSNAIYVYSSKDDRVGCLSKKELDFLHYKGFQIYETQYEHGKTIWGLVDGIEQGKIILDK